MGVAATQRGIDPGLLVDQVATSIPHQKVWSAADTLDLPVVAHMQRVVVLVEEG